MGPCIARHSSTVLWNPQRCTCQTYCCKCFSIVKNWDNIFSTWNEQYTRCRDFEFIFTRFYNCLSLSTSLPTTSTTLLTERSTAPSGCNIWLSQQQDGVACLFKGQGCNHVPIAKTGANPGVFAILFVSRLLPTKQKNEYVPPKNVPPNPSNRHELDHQVTVESRLSTLQGRKQRVDPWLFAGEVVSVKSLSCWGPSLWGFPQVARMHAKRTLMSCLLHVLGWYNCSTYFVSRPPLKHFPA